MTKKPMDTCKALRGTSCLCTKVRQCLWIGIRPSGLGDRLKSRQDHPEWPAAADEGDKSWPLISGLFCCGSRRPPFVGGIFDEDAVAVAVAVAVDAVAVVVAPFVLTPFGAAVEVDFLVLSFATFRASMGLRLRVLALLPSGLSSSSSSSARG